MSAFSGRVVPPSPRHIVFTWWRLTVPEEVLPKHCAIRPKQQNNQQFNKHQSTGAGKRCKRCNGRFSSYRRTRDPKPHKHRRIITAAHACVLGMCANHRDLSGAGAEALLNNSTYTCTPCTFCGWYVAYVSGVERLDRLPANFPKEEWGINVVDGGRTKPRCLSIMKTKSAHKSCVPENDGAHVARMHTCIVQFWTPKRM